MFGFIVGTLSLIGFVKVWKRGYSGRHRGMGPRRWLLKRLFAELDTTVGQEKVITAVADDAHRVIGQAREQLFRSRTAFARTMRAQTFDAASVDETLEAQQASFDALKKVLREGLEHIHEVLSPAQREQLADLMEYGPPRRHGRHGACASGWSSYPRSPERPAGVESVSA